MQDLHEIAKRLGPHHFERLHCWTAAGRAHTPLQALHWDETESGLLQRVEGRVMVAVLPGMGGFFSKDTVAFQQAAESICSRVAIASGTAGFFTSDELPRYGLRRRDLRWLIRMAGARGRDCVVVYAYAPDRAAAVHEQLLRVLGRLADSVSSASPKEFPVVSPPA